MKIFQSELIKLFSEIDQKSEFKNKAAFLQVDFASITFMLYFRKNYRINIVDNEKSCVSLYPDIYIGQFLKQ